MPEISHEELLARIGQAYYLDNQSKVEIATEHGISRFQVARFLDEARAEGIVHIEIRRPGATVEIDAEALAAALGLHRVVVVKTLGDDFRQRDLQAHAVADELMAAARTGMTIGISWSRTLDLAARHVSELPKCNIVQLAGALPAAGSGGNPLELIQRLGRVGGGRTWPMWAPLVVDSAATAAGLRRQPEIADAMRKADSLDLAVVAIGAWAPNLSTVWDRVDNAVRQDGIRKGAVAECSGRLIAADGTAVQAELDARILSVTVEQLQRTPKVIAVAQGAVRAEAVRACIAAGIVHTLVLDESLALALQAHAASHGVSA
ncbi:putative transcriptional regulator, MarR family [Arthrobacter sp. PAMC 25486]|uniref:sugar-binding transcriptional regulator n=1 Tax=Arthrobacter sp. PAMC 25486 TaxID=1494608 RepID=UPI000535CDE6|nr:sugar-binding domain-containing protein [Arthrobacter sp. PAMC 25486]AIY02437.1 putative transcriptional regulator, MarR family [Arthrobacter sp. PAMC 25486]